jgi:hypothetical protein
MNGTKYVTYTGEPSTRFTKQVYYQTLDSRNYSAIKTRLEQLGYELEATLVSPNLAFYYVKGKHWIELTSSQGVSNIVYKVNFRILK